MAKVKEKEKKGQVVPRVSRNLAPFDELDRLFDQMWEGGWLRPFERHWPMFGDMRRFEERLPKVDVIDREDEVVVKAELPGIDKEHLDVSLSDDYLTIKTEEHEEKKEEGELYRSEIHHGSFMRRVHLPTSVDGEKASASFKDGVLEITMPKSERVKKHKVEIK